MDVKVTFADIDEETKDIAASFQDTWDSIGLSTGDDDLDRTWCDWIIAKCKAEIERRKGILDELTQEAQELKIGY